MIRFFVRSLAVPGIVFGLYRNLRHQRAFIARTLQQDIDESRMLADGSLSDADYKKVTDYYGLAVPAILGEAYCVLRGRGMSEKERRANTYLGAISGLIDDLFDNQQVSDSYIRSLVVSPGTFVGKNDFEELLVKFYRAGLSECENPSRIMDYCCKVHEAQILSRKQTSVSISNDEIEQITYEKGGWSVLYFRSIFDDLMSDNEVDVFYNLGALMQLENDLFDVYKDFQGGIRTLVTTATDVECLRRTYEQLTDKFIGSVRQTHFEEFAQRHFLQITLLVICRGFVCLDMLQEAQLGSGNEFCIAKYGRKQLICDMEKPANMMKTVYYFTKYNLC